MINGLIINAVICIVLSSFYVNIAIANKVNLPIVKLKTDLGNIILELERGRAPLSTCNFIRYVEGGLFDGGAFVRTLQRRKNDIAAPSVIQGAARNAKNRYFLDAFGGVPLETTQKTGLSHLSGTVSMVREEGIDSATSGFFIVVDDSVSLDYGGSRRSDGQGFAAFGRVKSGMNVVRAIQSAPVELAAAAPTKYTGHEWLAPPIKIVSAQVLRFGERCQK